MKYVFVFFAVLATATTVFAQERTPDEVLLKMNIFEVCQELGLPGEYRQRYDNIIIPLCEDDVIIFDGSLNSYTGNESRFPCYEYIGTGEQNQKLIRNLVANRHLIENGGLVSHAGKEWNVIE